MFGFSEKTGHWILGFFFFNIFVFLYIYTCFYQEWIRTLSSVILPIFVWEILIFGILAPDDVFTEIFGETNAAHQRTSVQGSEAPIASTRAVIRSSGDH